MWRAGPGVPDHGLLTVEPGPAGDAAVGAGVGLVLSCRTGQGKRGAHWTVMTLETQDDNKPKVSQRVGVLHA